MSMLNKNSVFAIFMRLALIIVFFTPVVNATEITDLMSHHLQAPFNEEIEMIKVRYAPGEKSEPHRHRAHTLVYMLEGTVEMQVEGGELVRLVAGDTFYESPEDIHLVSRNASEESDAAFLVIFIKSQGAKTVIPMNELDG
ncbi:MAG: cupin [Methylophaga sp.]|nr:cupin [Methylophaga sp.]